MNNVLHHFISLRLHNSTCFKFISKYNSSRKKNHEILSVVSDRSCVSCFINVKLHVTIYLLFLSHRGRFLLMATTMGVIFVAVAVLNNGVASV